MSKQKMFSVIPLFPQNSCPLATALEIQISSFEVVNNYIGLYGHVNSPTELDKIKIIQKTNVKFPEAVLNKFKTKRQSTHPVQVLQKLRIFHYLVK